MARQQTRRTVYLHRPVYERVKAYCAATGISMSKLVESQVNAYLDAHQGRDGHVQRG